MKNIFMKALRFVAVVLVVAAITGLMGYVLVFGPDDSDDARLQAFEESMP